MSFGRRSIPRKVLQAACLSLGAAGLSLAIWQAGGLRGAEALFWGWRVKLSAEASPQTESIRVILLDQASLDWGASEMGWTWPWPRQVYAPLIDFCRRGGAKSISFDVLFTEPSQYGVADDRILGEAFARMPTTVAMHPGRQAEQHLVWPGFAPRKPWLEGTPPEALAEPGASFPIPEITTHVGWLANVKDEPDADGVFRRATLLRVFDGQPIPSLGLAAWLASSGESCRWAEGRFHFGKRSVPIDAQGRMILRYRGPSGTHPVFSAASVIQSELRLRDGQPGLVDPALLRDCHVLFGFSAPGLKDLRSTPVSGDYPGVEIHATLLDNLLSLDPLQDTPGWANALSVVLISFLAGLAILHAGDAIRNVLVFGLSGLGLAGAGLAAYAGGWWWPMAPPVAATAVSLVAGVVWNFATEGRQKRFIKTAFNQYVGPAVLDELVAHPEKLRLGGEKRELTMFFSDLEKFSTFSERLDPPRLVELLNEYLSELGGILREEGAYLDKFVGDAIIAFWNAPVQQADHRVRAVRASLRCQRRCDGMRQAWRERFGADIRSRIGLNTGEVVVGNMGSRDKFNYTMLGDAANTAARLEGANKAFGTYILVAEPTWRGLGGAVRGREIGAITVVGRKRALRVFEPMALADEILPDWLPRFEAGLAACRAKEWQAALASFQSIPDDPVSRVYANRCLELAEGRLADWDGIWNLIEK